MKFKCGIEIHQQLNTGKLFSPKPCSQDLEHEYTTVRTLRSLASEAGEYDQAAQFEESKKQQFSYVYHSDTASLVDLDEEPPHEINKDALDIAVQIALLLKMYIPSEVIMMRKLIINGSTTSGFQRTGLVAVNGSFMLKSGKRVRIPLLSLEEDSARQVGKENGNTVFCLDRLGVPLIELSTDPVLETVEEVHEAVVYLGYLLRSFEKTKRGKGTIRQDINISIPHGARIEIKGVQNLEQIPLLIEYEHKRQTELLAIKNQLAKEKEVLTRITDGNIEDITEMCSKVIKVKALQGKRFFIKRYPSVFSGIFGRTISTYTLGKELSFYLRSYGLGGIIHSDEDIKEKYGLDVSLEKELPFIIVALDTQDPEEMFKHIDNRLVQLVYGIPEETRKAELDGSSSFLRPLAGAARMYPETDVQPIQIVNKEALEKTLPELFQDKLVRLGKQWSMKEQEVKKLLTYYSEKEIEQVCAYISVQQWVTLVFEIPKELEKSGKKHMVFSWNQLLSIAELWSEDMIDKRMISEIYQHYTGEQDIRGWVSKMFAPVEDEAIQLFISEKIKELGEEVPQGIIIKHTLQHFKNRVSGKKVSELLRARKKE